MTNEASTSSPQVAIVISSTSNRSGKPINTHSVFSSKLVNRNAFSGSTWVIDTGVTDHMIHSITLFTTISSVLHTNVELPNGEFALVTHIGTVKLSNSLTLTNVLCVPSFSFNLIPVSKITSSLNCCLFFLSKFCFVQDLVRWRTIGMGEEKGGLYFLQGQTPSSATSQGPSSLKSVSVSVSVSSANKTVTNRSSNQDMWHYWLGHPSYSNFHFL
jgi:hypothetical protein